MNGNEDIILGKLRTLNDQLIENAHKVKQDFEYRLSIGPFNGSAIASGTLEDTNGTAKHPGVVLYKSSTSANSGYAIKTGSIALLLAGKEKDTFIFRTAPVFATVTRYLGYHSGGVNANEPSYGVYIAIDANGVASGKARNGGSADSTVATAQLLADTWYRAVIEVNADGTAVTFKVYSDDSDTTVLSETLITAKVPKAQTVGVCDFAVSSGTTVIILGCLDYIDYVIPNSRKV
jgi:hypothetical protein